MAATSWYPFSNNVTARGEIMEPYSLTEPPRESWRLNFLRKR
ncbi:hypothetical protein [Escherichia coli]|nr:hypothetical protein [Escherichia coli]MCP8729758.1 hypothetical protein [Escherichia coli]MDS1885829.1 hypothetical protein [Escherichia coli]